MSDFPETRDSLIQSLVNPANEKAWTEFEQLYTPVVLAMAKRRGMQDADARDVSQQVLISVSRAVADWQPGKDKPPFRAWLSVVARNAITKVLARVPSDRGAGSTSVLQRLNAEPDPSASAEMARAARRQIILALAEQVRNEFSPEIWEAFWLSAIEGLSVSEVVKKLGKSPGAIYVARYRVIARMRDCFQRQTSEWDI
ncbi:MAG TPA: hypothetical protein DDW52_10125 [Planctomycetaceae bacterium]|nr:hypothetical protein [Planctomycetaceae bacterium]